MPDNRRTTCQSCGQPSRIVGGISWRGNCETCGLERQTQAIVELAEKRGPMYRRWRARILAGIEATPLDVLPPSA